MSAEEEPDSHMEKEESEINRETICQPPAILCSASQDIPAEARDIFELSQCFPAVSFPIADPQNNAI